MSKPRQRIIAGWLAALFLLAATSPLRAADLRVAVAANFLGTLQTLGEHYKAETGQQLMLSAGSSGALYAQIVNGAPFDLFLSADSERPQALEKQGLIVPGSRHTYAVGVPVLWSATPGLVDSVANILREGSFRHIAIADPRHAPYGVAAQQILEKHGVWSTLEQAGRIVRAQSIGQAYSQVASGAAPLGFVALSQIKAADGSVPGSHWIPPRDVYAPIKQQMVILKRADQAAAAAFAAWLRSERAAVIIAAAGYLRE